MFKKNYITILHYYSISLPSLSVTLLLVNVFGSTRFVDPVLPENVVPILPLKLAKTYP